MTKCSITVSFDIAGYNIPRKFYTLDNVDTIRYFRTIVLDEIKRTHEFTLSVDEEYNYGFARVDEQGRCIYFLKEHEKIDIFLTSAGKIQPGLTTFAPKSRLSFPNHLSPKDIAKANKPSKRQKFMKAIQAEDIHKITKLLEKGLDPNFIIPKTQDTPMFAWANTRPCMQEAILNILLQHGAHIEYRVSQARCLIHKLISTENTNAIRLIFYKNASFEEWDSSGVPALFYALDGDVHIRCLEYLLELNPPMEIVDSSGNNLLHYCCKKGLANHLGVIIKYIATSLPQDAFFDLVFSLNNSGNTPIHLCVLQSQKSCLEMLIRRKDCLEVRNSSKDTVLQLAIRIGETAIIDSLNCFIEKFSNPNVGMKTLSKLSNSASSHSDVATLTPVPAGNGSPKKLPVNSKYPLSCICISNYTPTTDNELNLGVDEVVVVILVLSTKVAFGYKEVSNKRTYGWFPSSCIGMDNDKKIISFQKLRATIENLSVVIPSLLEIKTCNFIPTLILVYMEWENKSLGMEIACRKPSVPGTSDRPDSQSVKASPFYVRNLVLGSPADKGGLRVGDQIVYILSNEITNLPMKTVSVILKSICSLKIPDNMPKNTLRQISFIVLRHNDSNLKTEEDVFNTADMMSDVQSINTQVSSNFTGFTYNSSDGGSSSNRQSERNSKVSFGKDAPYQAVQSSSSNPYYKDLPKVPNTYYSTFSDQKSKEGAQQENDDSSDDNLPLPHPELLCDV